MAIDVALEVLTDPDFLIDLTLRSTVAGGYVDGLFVAGAASSVTIQGSIQPATAEDYNNLPEGERVEGLQTLFTLTELKGSKNDTEHDIIKNYLGRDWKVVNVAGWSHHGYFKCMLIDFGVSA